MLYLQFCAVCAYNIMFVLNENGVYTILAWFRTAGNIIYKLCSVGVVRKRHIERVSIAPRNSNGVFFVFRPLFAVPNVIPVLETL